MLSDMEGILKALEKLEKECLKVLRNKEMSVETKKVVNGILRCVYGFQCEIVKIDKE